MFLSICIYLYLSYLFVFLLVMNLNQNPNLHQPWDVLDEEREEVTEDAKAKT